MAKTEKKNFETQLARLQKDHKDILARLAALEGKKAAPAKKPAAAKSAKTTAKKGAKRK